MVTSRELARPTFAVFLPAVVFVLASVLVIEPLIRGHNVNESLRQLKQVYLPVAVAEPPLMAVGYGLGLWLLKSKLNETMLRQGWLHVLAGLAAVLVLGVTSVFSQGAHLPWIVSVSVAAGVLSALIFFGLRSSRRTATADA
jgi:hypothetical protein